MGLDIWFKEDIANALRAAEECAAGVAELGEPTPELRAYRAGFRAALATLAVAFGLVPTSVERPALHALPPRLDVSRRRR
jgi:hypothetical protein